MSVTAVAMLSGGLDSMLAIRTIQLQQIRIEAINVRTHFQCCQDRSAQVAHELGVRLTAVAPKQEYLDLLRRPAHGYGRGANPCVDCRIYMFTQARKLMEQLGAAFVISGEVLGQRPMSQKRRDLFIIARQSGLGERLLRPLSAGLLPPTRPELDGLVDRRRLHSFAGRSRKGLIALARQLGFETIPSPSTGCVLTEPGFAGKVHDLVGLEGPHSSWDFELLKVGRHIRFNAQTKVVLGRRAAENERLQRFFYGSAKTSNVALVQPGNFTGPTALVVGMVERESLQFAGGLILRFAKAGEVDQPTVNVHRQGTTHAMPATLLPSAAAAQKL